MGNGTEQTKVIFIGGESRSGSTLLDLLLGQIDGFFSVGELRYIWERGFRENQLCGCGQTIHQCPFWSQVAEEAFGSVQKMDIDAICALWNSVERTWYRALVPFITRRDAYRDRFAEYTSILSQLYAAIQKVSGTKFVVDSSKKPFHGLLLAATPTIDLYTIHLIRDCRAVVYSWQRRKTRPEIHWQEAYMPTFRPTFTITSWSVRNVLMDVLKYINPHHVVLQYEALAYDPHAALARVLAYVQAGAPASPPLRHLALGQAIHHTVAGNPMRFQRQTVAVQPDTEWQHKMSKRQRWFTTAFSWPLLWKYGYFKGISSLPYV